jgi:DNA (cytosine-5)-methyltransferase 1
LSGILQDSLEVPARYSFEPESVRGDPGESSGPPEETSGPIGSLSSGGFRTTDLDFGALIPFDEAQITHPENRSKPKPGDPCPTLNCTAKASVVIEDAPICFYSTGAKDPTYHGDGVSLPVKVGSGNTASPPAVARGTMVRRFTPTEVERLFGFPDGYTAIPGASDSARYQALGNTAGVPVLSWLGQRIAIADAALEADRLA